MIDFKNVTATFSDNAGIFDLTFHIDKGEIAFLMGPTGAGKSTVLRAIYKDIPVKNGRIIVNGNDTGKIKKRKIPIYRRSIGTIFQDFKLLDDRTVFENVALPLHIVGVPRKLINQRVNEVLEQLGLLDLKKEHPNNISGGEQQRIAIARALVKIGRAHV